MSHRTRGYTLIELAITMAIIAVLLLTAITSMDGWGEAEASQASARSLAAALDYARGEAIRTGDHQIVMVSTDLSGNPLVDESGSNVPILVLDDGRPGSAGQNCAIDAGEEIRPVHLRPGISFGVATSTRAPNDDGAGAFATGSSFTDPSGNAATWVLFRPDGIPRAVDAACSIGPLGSGSGAFYLGNATREAAVVLSALGASRVYTLEPGADTWK